MQLDWSDAYILVSGMIRITGAGDNVTARQAGERSKGVMFKNCALFADCTSKCNAKDLDVVVLMYNLIEYGNNYSKTSGSLWQYYRDEPNFSIGKMGVVPPSLVKNLLISPAAGKVHTIDSPPNFYPPPKVHSH